ncbi:hypothetical protein [Chryseobacterium oncorhynchi]|nr:hypothetical protein [Chryseobacterium oncorhynchi]
MGEKKLLLIILMILFNISYSQQYISLDSLQSNYTVKKYTLQTKELYGIDKTIELYNVYVLPHKLVLFTVLPNLEGNDNWKKLDVQVSKEDIYTKKQLENWIYKREPKNKDFGYGKIIKKVGKHYYASAANLIEVFNIENYPFPLVSSYGTINTMEKKVSINEMAALYTEIYTKRNPKLIFPMDVREADHIHYGDMNYNFRNYLSKEYKIGKNDVYQFWTFDGWWVIDGYNSQRGIDRFAYIPEKGIVGGSYDFYFAFLPKQMLNNKTHLPIADDKLWDNIMNEKIMIAKEIK